MRQNETIDNEIFYFAWLKEHAGSCEEMPSDDVDTVGELIPIARKSPGHKTAFANLEAVRVAVDRVYGGLTTPVADGDGLLFPPYRGLIESSGKDSQKSWL